MKQVLIVDAPPLFRGYLKDKLAAEKVSVEFVQGRRDAFTKMLSVLPDLIIIDAAEDIAETIEFMEKKAADPNAGHIPTIISGPEIERSFIADFAKLGVIKYFNKPIKFDIFFEAIGRVLKIAFSIDTTPCILETHLNGNIIFIEVATGLNREKISLLKYRITEMIQANRITTPKIVLMMTDLSLSFVDGANLEMLLDSIIADQHIAKKDIKVLALDSFTRELIAGHKEYDSIQVSTNLSAILNSLVDNSETHDISELISDKILSATEEAPASIEMRFYSETGTGDAQAEHNTKKQIAIADDDTVLLALLKKTFSAINADVSAFSSGTELLASINKTVYDLVILDIMMPGLSGFNILKILQQKQYPAPVVIYSGVMQRESIIQALSLGAKAYLLKPLAPDAILQKALEIMNAAV
ncbi:response regulator [Treponema brennaborense]|uniref:Response regulator receiver protein n=1 Tax=Treponema brennaborense (strain DSM 12168 / CIP 105900 / DD5/3) TaxID=906968 RepID=F4LK39_TREBD|nr:response regulator [Treponema brennaborense]AEE17501.1 response regulator receiver protein [Treponema brennaborense DSM 12168]